MSMPRRLFQPVQAAIQAYCSPGQCSADLWHPHKNHVLHFGLDKSLMYIEREQIQLHLAGYRSYQADKRHSGGRQIYHGNQLPGAS